eukprot:COSAG02_NODE_20249_length_841_cov_1.119946_2_plen_106_part_00
MTARATTKQTQCIRNRIEVSIITLLPGVAPARRSVLQSPQPPPSGAVAVICMGAAVICVGAPEQQLEQGRVSTVQWGSYGPLYHTVPTGREPSSQDQSFSVVARL